MRFPGKFTPQPAPFHARLTLIFVVLAAILEGALASYWLFILEPRLDKEITAYAHALSQAQAQILALDLAEHQGQERLERLTLAMDKILLFRLPQSNKPFTKQIMLEVDYDVVSSPNISLDLTRGEINPENTTFIDIPLYSPTSKELLGIAQFSNNKSILNDLKEDARTKLILGSSLIIIILTIVWFTVLRLNSRLSSYANKLAQAEKITKQIIATMQDARIVMDTKGYITEINPYTEQLLHYNNAEMIGHHISTFIAEPNFLKGQHLQIFKEQQFMDNIEITFIAKGGIAIAGMISGALVEDSAGNFAAIICLAKDMSALKDAERQLEEKRVQMVHQGRLSALGEMATGMAHEINQPLYIIRLAADGLRDFFHQQAADSLEAGDVDKILAQVERANTIITNMRSFARADNHAFTPQNIAEPINLALSFFREQFRQHNIALCEEIDPNLAPVLADPQKFEQIVVNFLSNARYAVNAQLNSSAKPYTPVITIRLAQHGPQIIFEVEDNGIGMDEKSRKRCMEPFFTTKEVGQGTGLGLSIIHGIITEMNMQIEIESNPGQGSCFRVIMRPEPNN